MLFFHKKTANKIKESIKNENNIVSNDKIEEKPIKIKQKETKSNINKNVTNKLSEMIESFCDHDKFILATKEFADAEFRDSIEKMIDYDSLYYLFYGDIPSYCKNISKVDYNKDCKTFKILMTDVTDLRRSVRFLRRLIRYYDSFLYQFNETFRSDFLNDISESDPNYGIVKRIECMLDSYSTDTTYCFNIISNLLYSLDIYYEENPNSVGKRITFTKHDTLKRYYFVHTYSLKGAVKIFNNDTMIFGEINNTIKQYDYIFDFVFGTIICNIQTLKTIFSNIKS